MESFRFTDKFEYTINIGKEINTEQIEIPPMLIQPYLENAIWHGLMHLENKHKGKATLSFHLENDRLEVVIEDNGIGRARSAELKMKKGTSHKQSMGIQITENRIKMINKLYDAEASVVINDLFDKKNNAAGTRVILKIKV
jgi:LytS/YehU family sensor histidine kinase